MAVHVLSRNQLFERVEQGMKAVLENQDPHCCRKYLIFWICLFHEAETRCYQEMKGLKGATTSEQQ